jgi:hypothetical protein
VAIDGGYAAIERKYDVRGDEVRTSYFGIDNRPIPNRNEGFAIKKTLFDECGREIENTFLDKNEHLVRSKKGYAHIQKTYDDNNKVAAKSSTSP